MKIQSHHDNLRLDNKFLLGQKVFTLQTDEPSHASVMQINAKTQKLTNASSNDDIFPQATRIDMNKRAI